MSQMKLSFGFGTSIASGIVCAKSLRWLTPAASCTVPAGRSHTLPLISNTSDFSQVTILVKVLPEAELNAAIVFGSVTLKKSIGTQPAMTLPGVPQTILPLASLNDGPMPG